MRRSTKPLEMQRRHFEFIANVLSRHPNSINKLAMVADFATILSRTNCNFKRDKFIEACGVKSGIVKTKTKPKAVKADTSWMGSYLKGGE